MRDVVHKQTSLGDFLRQWRALRGKSQFALALDAGISQRHVSFIEIGRSAPSRSTLLAIARALDIPLRERNQLLLAGGFAPLYSERPWDAPEMDSIAKALDRILRQHDPYPAVVMDRSWNVILRNQSAPRFFNAFIDLESRPHPRNLLDLMIDPNAMRSFIVNWAETARMLRQRAMREAVGGVVDATTLALLDALPNDAVDTSNVTPSPVVPVSFRYGDEVLHYFSMITTVGTPQTVSAQELRIESMFPLDDKTEELHAKLMREHE